MQPRTPLFVKAGPSLADKSDVTFPPSRARETAILGRVRCATPRETKMQKPKRQLVLNKGAERFIFRYEAGCEDELLDALVAQAKDNRTDFDWFDAAVLSFKLTQTLMGHAEELLRSDPNVKMTSS
jgi:hypothetical protein